MEILLLGELLFFSMSLHQVTQGLVYLFLPLGGRTFKQCHKYVPESSLVLTENLELSAFVVGQGV